MPISRAPYKRGYKHVKGRGRESLVECDGCGRRVPRYKTFVVRRGMRFGPDIMNQVDRRFVHMMVRVSRFCPACARFRKVSEPEKSRKSSRRGRSWA